MNWLQDGIESSYLFEHFVGCLRNFQLKTGPDFTPLKPLKAYAYRDIVEGCVDKSVLSIQPSISLSSIMTSLF